MSLSIALPTGDGQLVDYTPTGEPLIAPSQPSAGGSRVAFAAAHVVADPLSEKEPSFGPALDYPATLAFRRHLLDLGLGVAEAMDTSQRGMGLYWEDAKHLIRHSLEAADVDERERIFSGVGTDQLDPDAARSVDDVIRAYLEQLHTVQGFGGRVIMMASRALARVARGPEDYATVYGRVLSEADRPAILHWLGEMFDPALAGYWGADGFDRALDTALGVIAANAEKIDGIKISLLDDKKEIQMRRLLPSGVRMYTGDDFNYPDLIKGDQQGYSDALLGIFDPIAPAASIALTALAGGDEATFDEVLAPTVPLSRLIFRAPTQYYKTGVVFMAWLNGFQEHFVMIAGAQAMRPIGYFSDVFQLADQAGLLRDPELAVARMKRLLAVYGVEA
ncbi:MAG: dihydrodipicolinate synthase family protein [Alphaproteobacteria bacterium]|nr:dihydrodipicolinate synthase family protein [Alphaproteobacteria bacterium]